MNERMRLRRRSRPSLAARLRAYWLVAFSGALLAAAAGWLVASSAAFHIAALTVTGLAHVSRDEVVRRAAIDPHANVWFLDRRAIEGRIAAIPYVALARVHRRPLANVWLEVKERRAEACVRDADGATLLVDGDLRVLELGCARPYAAAYRVRTALDAVPGDFLQDPELVALQKDARLLAAGGARYRAFAHDAFGQLEATLQDGITVRFGDDGDLTAKQRLIVPILAQLGPRAAEVRSLDLRAPATPVVEYRVKESQTAPRAERLRPKAPSRPQRSTT